MVPAQVISEATRASTASQAAAPGARPVRTRADRGRRAPRRALLHAYSASKAGLIGLAQALASELAPHVTVNCLCPVSTPETGMGRR